MKKMIAIATALFLGISSTLFAQELTSKKGFPILPAAGDYAIGIDATPMLDFVGNVVKINSGAAFASPAAFNFINGQTIVGKYFVDASTAYRAKVRIGMGSITNKEYTIKDGQADPFTTVEDKEKLSGTNIVLGAGLEKRRGAGRLQGFYGAEAQINLASNKAKYTYGNDFSTTNTAPSIEDFGSNDLGGGQRVTEVKGGGTFGLGVRGFVGVEYFLAPKVSLGGEFGWGLGFASTSDTEVTTERWDGATSAVKTEITINGGGGTFGLDTDNNVPAGCIYLMFHF